MCISLQSLAPQPSGYPPFDCLAVAMRVYCRYGKFFGSIWVAMIREDKNLKEKNFEESIKKRWP